MVIWKSFAKIESIRLFLLSLKFFVSYYMWSEEDKTVLKSLIETTTKDDKSDLESGSLRIFWVGGSSKSDGVF